MIKVIIHITKVIIAVITALLFSSCVFSGENGKNGSNGVFSQRVSGNGNVIEQDRNITQSFTYIAAGNGLEVLLEQGNQTSVTVEADENLQQYIKTEVDDNELKIYTDANITNAKAKKITVRMPEIKGISTSSSASVTNKTLIKAENLNLSSSSGSNLNVTIDTENVACESSSGSTITVRGNTTQLTTDSSSGSSLNAKGLTAKSVTAEASSGSNTSLNPQESLNADASSGANIQYITVPKQLNKETSSGGSIYKG
ncbi:DUF2807 domain-containing protein [Flavobacterium sp. LaA7.5]|nr:DUF2807 domain-containing protein [Flavobacterium salilacus subsp. altitudinum]